jgi:hypothetical protein
MAFSHVNRIVSHVPRYTCSAYSIRVVCLVPCFHLSRGLYFSELTSGVPHFHRPTRLALV